MRGVGGCVERGHNGKKLEKIIHFIMYIAARAAAPGRDLVYDTARRVSLCGTPGMELTRTNTGLPTPRQVYGGRPGPLGPCRTPTTLYKATAGLISLFSVQHLFVPDVRRASLYT